MSEPLKEGWQVAAWSSELGGERPLPRRLNDVPLALYRLADGTAVALHDRCPHQGAPLSMGRLQDDRLHCAFHGLGFNREGRCDDPRVHASVRESQRVRCYPLHEHDGIVWIWMHGSPPGELLPPGAEAPATAAGTTPPECETRVTRIPGDLAAARAQLSALPTPDDAAEIEDYLTPGNALFTHHFRRLRHKPQTR
ncbi:MAG: hypothetical protein RL026_1080 [Pseudomonadota bacterium]|jgi:phenylpropionate dioxygenase-like ring-hydroxylating dioxygenase large terminal subunit